MATITTGVFFLGKRDAVQTTPAGPVTDFRLTLRVLDRQGPHKVEGYVVTWEGAEAAGWWSANRSIEPGTPLELELANPRAMPGRLGSPEIHAAVRRCRRAPVAPSWQAAAKPPAA